MSGGFEKIKKLVKINNVIKSTLNSAAVASLLGAVFMLLKKREIYAPSTVMLAAVLGGAFALTFLVSLLIFKKSDKKLALGIDTELNFNERVQTMVAFKSESGSVIDMQREDANRRLMAVKRVKITRKGRLASVLAFILAAGMLASSILLVPQKVEAAEPEAEYEMTDYEKQLLQNLIEYVERSAAVEKEKKDIVERLKYLQSYLEDTVKESEKKNQVVSIILDVNAAVDKVNFLDDLKNVSEERGFTTVSRFADTLTILRASTRPNANMAEAFAAIQLSLSPTRAEFVDVSSFERMGDFVNEVKAAIATVKNVDLTATATDPFIASLTAFCEEISEFCGGAKPQPTIVQEQFDIFFFGTPPYEESLAASLEQLNVKKLYNALCQENVNIEVGKYVVSQLMSIFNISKEMLPSEAEDMIGTDDGNEYAPPEEEEEQVITNGGLGDGNLLFGGNDTIYYPEEEDYAHYGDAIAFYQNKIIDMIENGLITDERLITYYENYFDVLFGSDKA